MTRVFIPRVFIIIDNYSKKDLYSIHDINLYEHQHLEYLLNVEYLLILINLLYIIYHYLMNFNNFQFLIYSKYIEI